MSGVSSAALDLHRRALIIDLHCDLLLTRHFLGWDWQRRHRRNPLPFAPWFGHCDLPRLREGNVAALGLGVVTNPLRRRSGLAAIERDLAAMHAEIDRSPDGFAFGGDAATIRANHAAGRISLFAGLEGSHGLGGELPRALDALPGLAARGLRYVTLCHLTPSPACRPMAGLGASNTAPLRPFGYALVEALEALGVLVDVAHVGKRALLDVCRAAKKPVICSHMACKAVFNIPRNLDDESLRAIADTDGVIGGIFVTPYIGPGGAATVARHLDHIRRTVGARHVALGSDWEGFAYYPSDLQSAEQLPHLTEALLGLGWSEGEIFGAYGENFLRAFAAARGA